MKKNLIITIAVLSLILTGCQAPNANSGGGQTAFFTVNFEKDIPLRYRFVTERKIKLDWGEKGGGKSGNFIEKVDLVMAYQLVDIDGDGVMTIKATCESIKTQKTTALNKEALEFVKSKSYTIKIDPAGNIKDYSSLTKLIQQAGKEAIRTKTRRDRIKEPDMISDFVATQWFLWDAYSSIEKPAIGVKAGESWASKLSIPNPMVLRKARNVTYTFEGAEETEQGRFAVINSDYSIPQTQQIDWPTPYVGKMRLSGRFGTLRNYKLLELQGTGKEYYNTEKERIEKYSQQYKTVFSASFLLPMPGLNPKITIDQKISMELLEDN
ncbi:MAG: hypothetical protein H8D47_04920 [Planctomycetes bacterium]|nr:hypothetical protein [Planctomycetota bacterium]MBL7106407.1 hypothetical protein [Phycisphaerae bacterium]